ncbi:hypothetical protein [Streptosporangium sp. NPDC023615]|uniref:hypothetical protein n=1 Tax=Streptosporangium sp. NPDC023615 TaxID=3154794 RepID=UPI003448BDA1
MLLVVGLLCGGLVSLLLLSAVLAQDSYRVRELNNDLIDLRAARESKKVENMRQDTPEAIARNNDLQGQHKDWDTARVIIPGGSTGAGDGGTPAGRERVPGTGR